LHVNQWLLLLQIMETALHIFGGTH
jgi:hypothetical protein